MGREMTNIRLDRNYYHLHDQIGRWCQENFGPVELYNHGNCRWSRDMMFGYQDYYFTEEADATFFTLKWVKQ